MSGSRCQSGDNRAGPGKASCGQEVRLRGSGQSRTVSSSPLGSITTGNASFGHVVTLRRCLPGRVVSAVPRRRRRLVCLPGTRPMCSSAEPRRPRVLTRVGPCPCPGRGQRVSPALASRAGGRELRRVLRPGPGARRRSLRVRRGAGAAARAGVRTEPAWWPEPSARAPVRLPTGCPRSSGRSAVPVARRRRAGAWLWPAARTARYGRAWTCASGKRLSHSVPRGPPGARPGRWLVPGTCLVVLAPLWGSASPPPRVTVTPFPQIFSRWWERACGEAGTAPPASP